MKIGINSSYAASKTPTGVGNYIINLLNALLEVDKENEYYLYYRSKISKKDYLNLNLPSVKFEPKLSWLAYNKIDIFHDPSARFIKIGKSRNIITVHDVVVALKEDYTSEKFKKQQSPKLVKALKKCDKIIAVSEFTKNELIKYFSVNPDKISVVHHGVDFNLFKPGSRSRDFIQKYNLPERYLLFVGNIEKRKNLFNIIKSFEKINKKDKDLHLVLTGKNGYGGEEIRKCIQESPCVRNIIELDYIAPNQLPQFYWNAELFFFPSYYEGFGMPILEALACGCPVITSNTSSIPEASEEAVLYVDPFNVDDIVSKTSLLLNNSKLKKYLIQKGLSHVKKFSWENTAQKTIKAYKGTVL